MRHVAVIILCGMLTATCLIVIRAAAPISQQTVATLQGWEKASAAATGVMDTARPVMSGLGNAEVQVADLIRVTNHRLNDPCSDRGACGTLADVNRTLATIRGTSGQVETGLLRFNGHSDELFTQERLTYANVNRAVADLDAVIANPKIPATVNNLELMSEQGVSTARNITATTTKFRKFSLWKPWTW